MTEPTSILNKKTFCVISGASRGYGKCLAEILVTRLPAGSCCLLLARSIEQLKDITANLTASSNGVKVACGKLDQSDLKDCSTGNIQDILSKAAIEIQDFETVMLLHNAGSTGDLTRYAWEMSDINMVESTMNVNVTGTILLNSSFLNEIRKCDIKNKVVINISSLAAIQVFPSWSLYCAGKILKISCMENFIDFCSNCSNSFYYGNKNLAVKSKEL